MGLASNSANHVLRGGMGNFGRKLLRSVIYEDENVVAINKWPGVTVQGGPNGTKLLHPKTLALLKRKSKDETPRLVHRLDKPTSGVLVFARTLEYARLLSDQFAERKVRKEYLAVTNGVATKDQTLILTSIAKRNNLQAGEHRVQHPSEVNYDALSDEAQQDDMVVMKTKCKVLEHFGANIGLIRLNPLTGFKHQLRIQCAFGLGTPIAGDRLHGDYAKAGGLSNWARKRLQNTSFMSRRGPTVPLMLHARSLRFPGCGPNGKDLFIRADPPSEFVAVMEAMGCESRIMRNNWKDAQNRKSKELHRQRNNK